MRAALVAMAVLLIGAGSASAQILPEPTPTATPAPSAPPPVVDPGPLGAYTTHEYGDAARRGAVAAHGLRPPLRSLWRHDFGALVSTAVTGGGRAYVHSGGRVTAIELATGRLLWTSAAEVGASLAYGGGKVVTSGGGLIALNAATGAVAWAVSDEDQTSWGEGPLIAGNLVITQYQGLTAYDLNTGARRWRGGDMDGVDGLPAAAGDRVYQFGGCTVAAVDRRDGDVLWRRNSGCSGGTSGTVAVSGDRVHSSFGSVPLFASNGRDAPGPKADIFAGGIGVQHGSEGGLAAVDLAAGRLLWSVRPDTSFPNDTLGAPLVAGETLFQTRFEGTVQARALRTGAITWQGRLRGAKETFTGSSSASDFTQAAGAGVLVVLRGSTVDGLAAAAGPPQSLAVTVPRPAKRLVEAGSRQAVRGRASGDLFPGAAVVEKDPYPFGRFKAAGKPAAPDEKGAFRATVKTDRNARVRLAGAAGSAAPTRSYVLYAYPRIRIGVRNRANRVTARLRVTGSRAIRYRGRPVHLYFVRARRDRMTKLGAARLRGPRFAKGRAAIRFPALRRVGPRDYLFACVPRVHRLGQGAPDRVQRRCGRARISF